jgi:hypothetical protein
LAIEIVLRAELFSAKIWAANFIGSMYKNRLPLLLLLLSCGSCTKSRVEPPAIGQPQPSPPNLALVKQATNVEIYNDWNGYSDITPILRHYRFRLKQRELVGNAHVAIGGYGAAGVHQQKTSRVKIPAAVTTEFLATLAKTPLQVGKYKPKIVRSDDYPSIKIQVQIDRHKTTFSSESQGVGNAPWRVTIERGNITEEYISNSTIPAQALKLFGPYLDLPEIDRIIQRRQYKK